MKSRTMNHFWFFVRLLLMNWEFFPSLNLFINRIWQRAEKVKETLSSDAGQAIYRRRKFDVEPVFGRMKRDFGVRRTHLRGQKAVENDLGLVLMAMNLTKLSKMIAWTGLSIPENEKTSQIFRNKSKIWFVFLYSRLRKVSFFPVSYRNF